MSLSQIRLRSQDGSALVTALMVMLVILPLGLALLAIVDTQAKDSGKERSRDRAFNLADSALTSGAFALGHYSWPTNPATAPTNTGAAAPDTTKCGAVPYGATLGATPFAGSTTARLQPNLNASYDGEAAYTGATWQLNVCDDDLVSPGPTVWRESLRDSQLPYDENKNQLMWIRSEARVDGRRRVLAALVRVKQSAALSPKFGLVTGRMNAEVTNSLGAVLNGGSLLSQISSSLLGNDPLVAADPLHVTSPPTSGITAVRCGALDGCLTGAIGGASALSAVNTLVTGGKLVQSTSPTAASPSSIAQLKEQAIRSGTYVSAPIAGSASSTSPPACAIPAGANADTVVYIEQVGVGALDSTVGGPGDEFCVLDVSANPSFKALIIGSGRIVLRGNNSVTNGGTFTGLVYALNEQRARLGDAATPTREVIRIDGGAHVRGGVAADGKSAQVGIYPPPVCDANSFLDLDCTVAGIVGILGVLEDYNPAIRSDVSVMNAVKIYDSVAIEPGTYRDVAGELR